MDFLFKFLETVMVFDVRINLAIAVLFWAFAALLLGLVIELVFAVGRKIKAANRLRKLRNKERVLFNMEVKSHG